MKKFIILCCLARPSWRVGALDGRATGPGGASHRPGQAESTRAWPAPLAALGKQGLQKSGKIPIQRLSA